MEIISGGTVSRQADDAMYSNADFSDMRSCYHTAMGTINNAGLLLCNYVMRRNVLIVYEWLIKRPVPGQD